MLALLVAVGSLVTLSRSVALGGDCGGAAGDTCDDGLTCLFDDMCDPECPDSTNCIGECVEVTAFTCSDDGDCGEGQVCSEGPFDGCSTECGTACDSVCIIRGEDEPTCEEDSDQWYVDYTGNSGKFKLRNECENNLWMQITIVSFTEFGTDGKKTKNKETSFAGDFEWVTDGDSEFNGQHAIENTYVGTMEIDGEVLDFNITTWFFDSDDETDDGYQQNSLKWTVSLSPGWPFDSDQNTLVLEMNVHVGGNSKFDGDSDDDEGWTYRFNNGFIIDAPNTCSLDGNPYPVDVTFDDKNKAQTDIFFTFGYFEESLEYDPVMAYTGDASSIGVNAYVLMFSALLACLYFV